jgi:uncharacterized protein (DUF2267 family)
MDNPKFAVFDETVQRTNEILNEIEGYFGWENKRNFSYAALRSVLQTLRDRLTINEASDFAAQLPLLMKGIFYDGWKPAAVPIKINKEEFLDEVQKKFVVSAQVDFEELVKVVLLALKKFVSAGEAEDVAGMLPKDLAEMLRPILVD